MRSLIWSGLELKLPWLIQVPRLFSWLTAVLIERNRFICCNIIKMEKYRRWTDEKVGINPFVVANTRTTPLVGRLTKPIQLFKLIVFLNYLPLFVVLYLIPIDFLRQKAARVMLFLLGVYEIEDYSLDKINKKSSGHRVLSNHSCFIDIAYYLYKFPGCSFLGYSEDSENRIKYYITSSLKAFFLSLFKLQPFYSYNSDRGYKSVEQALRVDLNGDKTAKLIIFYEKIRTNGRGTIKIDKILCDQLYELTEDFLIVQMIYSQKKDELFSLTTNGLSLLWASFGTFIQGNNLKVRATKQNSVDTHSSNELREAVFSMSSNPLLETSPSSYFQFLDFYKKTQKQGYKLQ